jgi:hypothetical protein
MISDIAAGSRTEGNARGALLLFEIQMERVAFARRVVPAPMRNRQGGRVDEDS